MAVNQQAPALSKNTAIALTVLLLLEVPAVHMLIGIVMEPGTTRSVVQGVLALSSLSLLPWLWRGHLGSAGGAASRD